MAKEKVMEMTKESAAAYLSQFIYHPAGKELEVNVEALKYTQAMSALSALHALDMDANDARIRTNDEWDITLAQAMRSSRPDMSDTGRPAGHGDKPENRALDITFTESGVKKLFDAGVQNSMVTHFAEEREWKRPRPLKEAAKPSSRSWVDERGPGC